MTEVEEIVGKRPFFDCPQCGHIGRVDQLKDHPVRPSPIDLGFCPECGGEVEWPLTEQEIRVVLVSYGDDPEVFLAHLQHNEEQASLRKDENDG